MCQKIIGKLLLGFNLKPNSCKQFSIKVIKKVTQIVTQFNSAL